MVGSAAKARRRLVPTAATGSKQRGAETDGAAARKRLMEAAIRLCCRDGVGATSVDAIVEESGVARMTLYNKFGSKDSLVLAALEHEASVWRAWFFARLAQTDGSARDRLLGLFDILGEWFRRDDYFGCALMNAVIEGRNRDSALLELTRRHKRHVLEHIRALATAADVEDVDATTEQIDLLMDGAIVKAAIKRDASSAAEAKVLAFHMLNAGSEP